MGGQTALLSFGPGHAFTFGPRWPNHPLGDASPARLTPLVANIFNFTSSICEFILVITGKNEAAFGNVAIAKVLLFLVSDVLSFVSNS